ncbi:MAG: ABC transporter ATP-binding protein [Bacillota bacterium]|nr:ABC transporter ATP-binding protein [Bacillota bacterium]
MTLVIELKNVTKTYPGCPEPAVKDFSLNVEEGSIITLLGPSGCGKTTLLRIIAGFEKPEKGSVFISGNQVAGDNNWVAPENRGVGMVFQDYALFPHLKVFDNVAFGYREKDKHQRVQEVLSLVSLRGYESRYPHELSGGQQQRVALARALARKPAVILLDEPFSNLDAELKDQMRLELKSILKKTGTTAVFVSHDQKDALAISDQIVVIKDGEIQQVGTPKEIYQYPENTFVATFVGRSNLLEGIMADDACSVQTDIGKFPCLHTHGHLPGEKVCLSIRPDGLEMSDNGSLSGTIIELAYTGDAYDAVISVESSGQVHHLMAHIHPEEDVRIGTKINFMIIPEFVAVVGNGQGAYKENR